MNKNYLKCKKIDTAINRAKKNLINSIKDNGVYENFGQNEVSEIKGYFINSSDYSNEMNKMRDKLKSFEYWCSIYK